MHPELYITALTSCFRDDILTGIKLNIWNYLHIDRERQDRMTIDERIVEVANQLADKYDHTYEITSSELKHIMGRDYGIVAGSVLPYDYCYNRYNIGYGFKKIAVFEYVDRGLYRVLGSNYPYNGLIYHQPKGDVERVVGRCVNGKRLLD